MNVFNKKLIMVIVERPEDTTIVRLLNIYKNPPIDINLKMINWYEAHDPKVRFKF